MTLDKIEGLDNGADDYIEKPFDILELISRVNARFRLQKNEIIYKDIKLNENTHLAYKDNQELDLTNMEFNILKYLLKNEGTVVSRENISKVLYQTDSTIESRSIDMHIASLRKNLMIKILQLLRLCMVLDIL